MSQFLDNPLRKLDCQRGLQGGRELAGGADHAGPALVVIVSDHETAWTQDFPIFLGVAQDLFILVSCVNVGDRRLDAYTLQDDGCGDGSLRHRHNVIGNAGMKYVFEERPVEIWQAVLALKQPSRPVPMLWRAEEGVYGDDTAVNAALPHGERHVDGGLPFPDTNIDDDRLSCGLLRKAAERGMVPVPPLNFLRRAAWDKISPYVVAVKLLHELLLDRCHLARVPDGQGSINLKHAVLQ